MAGQRFGRLTVLRRDASKHGRAFWFCLCDCGLERSVSGCHLRCGQTQSCGCLRAERQLQVHTKHGGKGSAEYRCWRSMLQRCSNPRNASWARYGSRGITVDPALQTFEGFLEAIGPRPSPRHSVDRIDNEGHYEPGNVQWALPKPQARNRASNRILIYDGRSQSMAGWAEEMRLPYPVLQKRLGAGWAIERALTTPVAARRRRDSLAPVRMESNGGSEG
jgi:hypothetical protein